MKKTLFTILLTLSTILTVSAQPTPYQGQIRVTFPDYVKRGEMALFRADVDYSALRLTAQQMVELTPVLRSTTGSQEQRFAPLVIAGSQRALILERAERLGGHTLNRQPSDILAQNNRSAGRYEITLNVLFEPWMLQSELVLEEQVYACGNRPTAYAFGSGNRVYTGSNYAKTTAVPYQPTFAVSYLTPEVEPVKTRGETYSARLTFPVGKSTLQPEFGDNARVLAEVDRIINEISADELLTVSKIAVRGYASPEGSAASNYTLSRDRAQALVSYISHRNTRLARMISVQGMGEDWAGLREAVAGSNIPEKYNVLDAIDNIADVERRKTALRKLDNGLTHRILSDEFYPELRRNEYTVEYQVRGLNAEEAKNQVWTRPQLLSLNELFLAAKLYSPDSREYKEIFEIAARMFPDSPVAQFNTAAMEIENGAYDNAIARLSQLETPQAWNNLAIAHWHKGDYAQAAEYLQKAATAGSADATQNLEQYNRWMKSK